MCDISVNNLPAYAYTSDSNGIHIYKTPISHFGTPGPEGRGIRSIVNTAGANARVTFTDDQTADIHLPTGPKGDVGAPGTQGTPGPLAAFGYSSPNGTVFPADSSYNPGQAAIKGGLYINLTEKATWLFTGSRWEKICPQTGSSPPPEDIAILTGMRIYFPAYAGNVGSWNQHMEHNAQPEGYGDWEAYQVCAQTTSVGWGFVKKESSAHVQFVPVSVPDSKLTCKYRYKHMNYWPLGTDFSTSLAGQSGRTNVVINTPGTYKFSISLPTPLAPLPAVNPPFAVPANHPFPDYPDAPVETEFSTTLEDAFKIAQFELVVTTVPHTVNMGTAEWALWQQMERSTERIYLLGEETYPRVNMVSQSVSWPAYNIDLLDATLTIAKVR